MGSMRALLLALALASPSPRSAGAEDKIYAYRSYSEILEYFQDLKKRCPDIVDTWYAQDEFPEILPEGLRDTWADCGNGPCRTLIVRVTNRARLTSTTPEVFFSGAVHGNERLGPLVVTELAGFLCSGYRSGDEDVRRLVDSRAAWIVPTANPLGFATDVRRENGMDPNRDFPYMRQPEKCMRTQTARVVNELFRRHLFQFAVTFHAGEKSLSYEWGSRDHIKGSRSTESPDDEAFGAIGQLLQNAAGLKEGGHHFYPLGRINDIVYPVNGGMEDWCYAAGWEASPSPIGACEPKTYGGYNASRTQYRPGSIAALVYLVEMDWDKWPSNSSLGRAAELWQPSSQDGHVARNLRMCLEIMELARPELQLKPPSWPSRPLVPGASLDLELEGVGCISVRVRLLLVPRSAGMSCGTAEGPSVREGATLGDAAMLAEGRAACRGLASWRQAGGNATPPGLRLQGRMPKRLRSGAYCAVVAAEFDQEWQEQHDPDPRVSPRSHAVRMRLEEHYTAAASEGDMRIDEFRTKLFPVSHEPLEVEEPRTRAGSAEDSSSSPKASALRVSPVTLFGPGGAKVATEGPGRSLGIFCGFAAIAAVLVVCSIAEVTQTARRRGYMRVRSRVVLSEAFRDAGQPSGDLDSPQSFYT